MWAVRQDRTGCGHAEVEFGRIELGVGMRRWSSAGSNWVWAVRQDRTGCGHAQVEFSRIELGVGMHRWSSAGSNWVWAFTGGVRPNWVWACTGGVQQDRTGCEHAEVEFGRIELGVSMHRWISAGY